MCPGYRHCRCPGFLHTAFDDQAPTSPEYGKTLPDYFDYQEINLTRHAKVVSASKAADENGKHYGLGYNIVGNSFTSGISIKKVTLKSGEEGVEMDNTVYIYTTGRRNGWKTQGSVSK